MIVRAFGWRWLGLGLMLGLGLFVVVGKAAAQEAYEGDRVCRVCHPDKYADYKQHGHPWQEIPTGGQQPGADLFGFASVMGENGNPVGVPDPTTYKDANGNSLNLTWADVKALVGNFKEGQGALVIQKTVGGKNLGYMVENGRAPFAYPANCFQCHNPTGYQPAGTMYGISDWNNGTPVSNPDGKAIQGVQCEHCHGPGIDKAQGGMQIPDKQICRDCHSTTGKNLVTGVESDPNKRIPFAPTADGKSGVFTNHHSQGDEYRRSPHKNQGCTLCHDPHKSVWHDDGGVMYSEEAGVGNMCNSCHNKRIRGAMGEIGLECIDCHMPEKSEGAAVNGVATGPSGGRRTHLFRINPTALAAKDNVTVDQANKKWWNSTDLNGDSFLTLDMVCTNCHNNMTLAQMATAAKAIHRQPGLVDITVNGGDALQLVKRTTPVSVDFSVLADAKAGMKADWWVICQTPKGWVSWDGKKWKAGLRPWRKNVALADVPKQNVLNSKLSPGYYTYWISIAPADSSVNFDGVPVYVTP